jgi:hypothetical protein
MQMFWETAGNCGTGLQAYRAAQDVGQTRWKDATVRGAAIYSLNTVATWQKVHKQCFSTQDTCHMSDLHPILIVGVRDVCSHSSGQSHMLWFEPAVRSIVSSAVSTTYII